MPAANTPQAPATRRSRRRSGGLWWLVAFMAFFSTCSHQLRSSPLSSIGSCSSQRTIQHTGAFHERDDVKQDDQSAERQRNGNRARAAAALLLLGERDSVGLVSHVIYQPPHVAVWTRRAGKARSIRSMAKSANR